MQRLMPFALALLGLAFALPVHASSIEHERLLAHIPFAFHLGDETMPAGNYEITQASDVDANLLEIRSADAGHAAFFFGEESQTRSAARPALVFDRYGKDRFLRAVWVENGDGDVMSATPAEVADARRVAAASHGRRHVAGSKK